MVKAPLTHVTCPSQRLGWARLTLEPEHLTDRVVDALSLMDARYERVETAAESDDVFVVNADISGVACRIMISRDPAAECTYRVTCSRLGGDTFAYHEAFRQLRTHLDDATRNALPIGAGAGASRAASSSSSLLPFSMARARESSQDAPSAGGLPLAPVAGVPPRPASD